MKIPDPVLSRTETDGQKTMTNQTCIVSAYNVAVPKIIYGTAWKKEDTQNLVATALYQGFRGIDTACQPKHYNEAAVGAGIAIALSHGVRREELYVQTKFTPVDGQDPHKIPYDPHASLSNQVTQSFQVSLQNLGITDLDCLVLHSPLATESALFEVWGQMEKIFDAGGVKQLGVSNCYDLDKLENLFNKARIKPAVVQNRFYSKTQYDRKLREFCGRHSILYQSFWTLTANPELLAHATVRGLANDYGRKPAQIFFRYLTQIGIIPLSGTRSRIHMREDLEIFHFELSQKECASLDRLI